MWETLECINISNARHYSVMIDPYLRQMSAHSALFFWAPKKIVLTETWNMFLISTCYVIYLFIYIEKLHGHYHQYLSSVVDPDSTLWIPNSHFLPSRRPADPVQGRRPLDGHTGSWDLVEQQKSNAQYNAAESLLHSSTHIMYQIT